VRFRVLLMRQIDMDHPSRIDFYGQMFQKFPEGTDTIMQKGACIYVKRLLERLLHIESEQAAQPTCFVMAFAANDSQAQAVSSTDTNAHTYASPVFKLKKRLKQLAMMQHTFEKKLGVPKAQLTACEARSHQHSGGSRCPTATAGCCLSVTCLALLPCVRP